ncbi:unnamed protein product [Spirodela intermedia]|uniref:Protein kinase domain-containing protein n=1 Tax=Spirodela intermedia TaxID=51605 RepID=A0A7I8IUP5_SPIIN|nr:unnamed protein product [Spirodela intermedia]CAA6660873.1 unnamed protein product [Spirodela intermedia]
MARWSWWRLFFLVLLLFFSSSISFAQQLSRSQITTLFRLQRILEYPAALNGWGNSTDLCFLPRSPSLSITCAGNRVTELSISGAGERLSGSFSIDSLFTAMTRLPSLTILSLTSLGLWGPLPAKLSRFRFLQSLTLTSNYISGKIPPEISSMAALASLSVAGNRLNGTVPAFVFSLPSLRRLDLSGNLLTGQLPAALSCAGGLSFVDLSRNRLVGILPACISSNSSAMAVFAAGNCLSSGDPRYQRPSSECTDGAIAADGRRSSHNVGFVLAIIGGAVGGAAVLGMALALVLVIGKTTSTRIDGAGGGEMKPAAGGTTPVWASPRLAADERRPPLPGGSMGSLGLLPPRAFTMEELEDATNNFDASNLVLETSLRQVYAGRIHDGSAVVVARLKLNQRSSPQRVLQFIEVISRLRHPHLCSLLGHCVGSGGEMAGSIASVFLVLERPSNGNLRSHLTEWRKREVFKWPQRVATAIEVARGIRFLHTVTTENILLDETLTAKITNYNLPTLSNKTPSHGKGASESPLSLFGDSSCAQIQSVEEGEKEDIYQLGIILLEIVTGKPATKKKELATVKVQLEKALAEEQGTQGLKELADPTIRGTFADDSMRTAVELALNCVSDDLSRRPSIDDILWNLQYSVQVQDGWATSEGFDVLLSQEPS